MKSADLDSALGELGLSQLAFGRLVDVNGRTVRRWLAGEAPIPGAVAALVGLALAVRRREAPAALAALLQQAAATTGREG